jgi:hypothetical protein
LTKQTKYAIIEVSISMRVYGCTDEMTCKNYSPENCTMCERCTKNADCYDLYEDLLDPLAEEADPDAE